MRRTRRALAFASCAIVLGCASAPPPSVAPGDLAALREQVFATERAFAKTMADRDFAAFTTFISTEAVFFARAKPLRGRDEITASWKRFYAGKEAPFSWEPAEVQVLDSGTLALSTGPVRDPAGKQFAIFTSVWRLEAPGTWRIILDKGEDFCDCKPH
jgi:ketosteroid isomerase-like protein